MSRSRSVTSLAAVFAAVACLAVPATAPALVTVLINEVDADQVSTDAAEFIELYDGGIGATSLNGFVLVFFNGTGDVSYNALDLDGEVTDANGYLIVGNTGMVPTPDVTFAPNTLQNGADAVALYLANAADFPNGTAVTTTNLVDALVYDTADADDAGLLVLLNASQPQVDEDANALAATESMQRCPDGSGGARNTTTYALGPPTPKFANCGPVLTVGDRRFLEGDSGSRPMPFYVKLSLPAPAGGVGFDAQTTDGTATDADNDYEPLPLDSFTIPEGDTELAIDITINGDSSVEAGQTFNLVITNVVGAGALDTAAVATLVNDDPNPSTTFIHDVQGAGTTTPLPIGSIVTLRGLVTGNKNNGFFLQEEDADADLDLATSEGIFVFTNTSPTDDSRVGNLVQITGSISEFSPPQDPTQKPITEIDDGGLVVASVTDDVGLPTPRNLTTSFPDPAGGLENLEPAEGMLVRVPSMTVVGPTLGTINEITVQASSDGLFYGVVTGTPRPFREAGIEAPYHATAPPCAAGSGCALPMFDINPERLRVDSDGQPGAAKLEVVAGQVLTELVGPLDYAFHTWSVLPIPGSPPVLGTEPDPEAGVLPAANELLIASFNIQRFFDLVNDPQDDPIPTNAAYDGRLERISRAIRDYLHMPDIIAIQEVEKIEVLEDIADQVDIDALANSQPVPDYTAHLIEGNDAGGIDVGYLIRTDYPGVVGDRVTVHEVVQELDGSVLQNPDTTTSTLNDRPPLRLSATVNFPTGPGFPLQVINVHQRSLGSVDSTSPGGSGWPTEGDRVRAKRQQQADELAMLIQGRQVNDPSERLVVLGDFNAFQVNDGYGDIMGTMLGSPAPPTQVVRASAFPAPGIEPDLIALDDLEPVDERYSFTFDGNAQSLDHVLINVAMAAASARRLDHARLNADFPQTARNDPAGVARVSDHDPILLYLSPDTFGSGFGDGFESANTSAWHDVEP